VYPMGDFDDQPTNTTTSESVEVTLNIVDLSETTKNLSLTTQWAGKFAKAGVKEPPVNLEDENTYQKKFSKILITYEDREGYDCGGEMIKTADVSNYTFDDHLVFMAEVDISLTSEPQFLYHNDDCAKHDLLDNLQGKFEDDDCDFVIVCEGRKIKCHRLLLMTQAKYFQSMLNSKDAKFNEELTNEVTIEDVDYDTMKQIVHYLYSLDIPKDLSREQITELLVAADRLQVPNLVSRCISALMELVTEDTYIQVFILVEQFAPDSDDMPEFMSKYPKLAADVLRQIACTFAICRCAKERQEESHLLSGNCSVYGDLRKKYNDLDSAENVVNFFSEVLARQERLEKEERGLVAGHITADSDSP
jgi:hypothetical protein